jgi:GntR family transcriptional regulator, carbon starvation induced regulator
VSACPSPWLLHFDWLLVCQFDRYRRLVSLNASVTKSGRQQEQALFKATVARNAKAASQILTSHIEDSTSLILRKLRDRSAS